MTAEPVDLVLRGAVFSASVLPCQAVLSWYYVQVLDETVAGSRTVAGFGPLRSSLRGAAVALVAGGAFLAVWLCASLALVAAVGFLTGQPPDEVPERLARALLVSVGGIVAYLVSVQVVALLADDRGAGSVRDVGRTCALAARRELLAGGTVAALLVLLGGVFGYALYVLTFGVGIVVLELLVRSLSTLDLFVFVGSSLAYGTSVYYLSLAAVRAFGLAARDAVAAIDRAGATG